MIGILAYGSLIDNPGSEIEPLIVKRIEVETPFPVEFARTSRSRDGAPTLIPVTEGGSRVRGEILLLDKKVSEAEATDMLWRRETGKIGSKNGYRPPNDPGPNHVLVERVIDFAGVETVLYTKIGRNIDRLTPTKLAELAINSTKMKAGVKKKDGISYLINAMNNGIRTPLMPQYVSEIIRITQRETLEAAIESLVNE